MAESDKENILAAATVFTAMPPEPTKNERTAHHKRRRNRQKEDIWAVLTALPEPFGLAAPNFYRDLDTWGHGLVGPIVDWLLMPPPCDPCALLNNPANRGKKHGKTVMEQIGLMQYGGSEAYESQPPTAPADASRLDKRGLQKRWQVESFVLMLRQLLEADSERAWHVVDFGCSTGALLLPLASLFPTCKFTGVEMKPTALAILRQRAAAAGLTNIHTFVGMIEAFEEPFDVALALHACGNATDAAMQRAEQHQAAYLVSPCCVGKLKFSMYGGTSFSATHNQWRSLPRMAGTQEQVSRAGEQLMQAAGMEPILKPLDGRESGGRDDPSRVVAEAVPARDHGGAPSLDTDVGGDLPAASSASVPLPELRHPRSNAFLLILPDPERHYRLMAQVADTNFSLEDQQQLEPDEAVSHGHTLAASLTQLSLGSVGLQDPKKEELPLATVPAIIAQSESAQDQGSTPPDGIKTSGCSISTPADDVLGAAAAKMVRQAALCSLAKLHIELDRNEAAREGGYAVGVFRMLHAGYMAKGDLLVGLPATSKPWSALQHLLQQPDETR